MISACNKVGCWWWDLVKYTPPLYEESMTLLEHMWRDQDKGKESHVETIPFWFVKITYFVYFKCNILVQTLLQTDIWLQRYG